MGIVGKRNDRWSFLFLENPGFNQLVPSRILYWWGVAWNKSKLFFFVDQTLFIWMEHERALKWIFFWISTLCPSYWLLSSSLSFSLALSSLCPFICLSSCPSVCLLAFIIPLLSPIFFLSFLFGLLVSFFLACVSLCLSICLSVSILFSPFVGVPACHLLTLCSNLVIGCGFEGSVAVGSQTDDSSWNWRMVLRWKEKKREKTPKWLMISGIKATFFRNRSILVYIELMWQSRFNNDNLLP